MNSTLIFLVIALRLSISLKVVEAWGKEGHEIVANIAYKHLSDATRASIDTLLLKDPTLFSSTDDQDMTPLGKVATWADQVRYGSEFHWTTPLHYVDIPDDQIPGGCSCCQNDNSASKNLIESALYYLRSATSSRRTNDSPSTCDFTYNRDCKNDMCVVGAIYDFSTLFRKCPHEEQFCNSYNKTISHKQSLMFLTHFVGDIHQPLHVSRKTDKGGNAIEVDFPFQDYLNIARNERDGLVHSTWNLHSVWDEGIIQHAIALYYGHSQYRFQLHIEELVRDKDFTQPWLECPSGMDLTCASSWASESWNDALRWSYQDENGHEIKHGDTLTQAYFHTRLVVIERRLAAASMRLAATLESIFHEFNC